MLPAGGGEVGGDPDELDTGASTLHKVSVDVTTGAASDARSAIREAGGACGHGDLAGQLHSLATLVHSYAGAVGKEWSLLEALATATASDLRRAGGAS